MRTFGLIGYPLTHSFSPEYFEKKFKREKITDAEYKLFPLKKISEFPDLIKTNPSLCGLNVTVPFKESVIPFLNNLDTITKRIGAVNCIKRRKMNNGKWKTTGFNTDIFGFENSLKKYLKSHHKKALILGTGGASKAVACVLRNLKINLLVVSRKKENTVKYQEITPSIIDSHSLIVNATPLGMYPDVNSLPDIPYELLTKKHLLFDLVYNPNTTLFMKKGMQKGATTVNGMEMLKLQAEESWRIWNE